MASGTLATTSHRWLAAYRVNREEWNDRNPTSTFWRLSGIDQEEDHGLLPLP